MYELTIPPAALRDRKSVELLRAWIAERQLHCTTKIGFYQGTMKASEGPSWGITLADVTRHIANSLEEMNGSDKTKVIEELRLNFLKELDRITSNATGEFANQTKS
jgi:uncharacterized protein DUF5076